MHKRAREPVTPTRPAAKRVRRSAGADAILDMSVSFKEFGNKLAASLAPPSSSVAPTPRRRNDSIVAAQQLKKLFGSPLANWLPLLSFSVRMSMPLTPTVLLPSLMSERTGFTFNSRTLVLVPLSILSRSFPFVSISVVTHLIIPFIAHIC